MCLANADNTWFGCFRSILRFHLSAGIVVAVLVAVVVVVIFVVVVVVVVSIVVGLYR